MTFPTYFQVSVFVNKQDPATCERTGERILLRTVAAGDSIPIEPIELMEKSGLGTLDDIDHSVLTTDVPEELAIRRHGYPTHRLTGISFRLRMVWKGSMTSTWISTMPSIVDIGLQH